MKVLGEISNGHIEFQFKSYSIQLKTCNKNLGLAEMAFGLVHASFRLPEGRAVKMIFVAP